MLTQKALYEQQYARAEDNPPASMPATKLEGFRQEFPWIWEIVRSVSSNSIRRVFVSRIEPDIMNTRPMRMDVGLLTPEYVSEYIWLLDENGEVVTAEFEEMVYRRRFFFWGKKIPVTRTRLICGLIDGGKNGATVADVLCNLGEKAAAVKLVLSYFEGTATAIVYKTPKDVSVPDWVRQQIEAERKSIQAACAEIDAEAAVS